MYSTRLYRDGSESDAESASASRPHSSQDRAHSPLVTLPGIWTAQPAVRLGGEAAHDARVSRPGIDALSVTGDIPAGNYLDQAGAGAGAGPGIFGGFLAGLGALLAEPTELIQILTSWTGGATEYGFQLKFRCRSTSGRVADLQAKAPNLIWRERVTYSRNDFARRISPPNPTILPPDGVSFAPASTRVVGTNLLEFTTVTDTHHMPTSAVRSADFPGSGFIATVLGLTLPAVMESFQVYQFSPDRGATWRHFAGGFRLRRTFFRDAAGNLQFTTNKIGIHSITEPYKP